MKKLKCDSCGNEDSFIIEGRIFIDGYGNYQNEEWDYEYGSPLRCGKCVEPISIDEIPDDFTVRGGPLNEYLVKGLNDNVLPTSYVTELMEEVRKLHSKYSK